MMTSIRSPIPIRASGNACQLNTPGPRFVDGLLGLPAVLDLVAGSCLLSFVNGLFCLVQVIAPQFRIRQHPHIQSG